VFASLLVILCRNGKKGVQDQKPNIIDEMNEKM
jgi:hypothetical protein